MTASPRVPDARLDPMIVDAHFLILDGRAAYGQSETAAMIGVTRQTVAAMIAAGDLRAVRVGRRVLIPAAEIVRLLGGHS